MRGRNKREDKYLALDRELNVVKEVSRDDLENYLRECGRLEQFIKQRNSGSEMWLINQCKKIFLNNQNFDRKESLYEKKYFLIEDE